MALPVSRDFDAVDAGPLPHTTVNNIQDAIVSLAAVRTKHIGPTNWATSQTVPGLGLPSIDQGALTGFHRTFDEAQASFLALPLEVGEQIREVRLWTDQTAAGTVTAEIVLMTDDGNFSIQASDTHIIVGTFTEMTIPLVQTANLVRQYMIRLRSSGVGIVEVSNTYMDYLPLV